MDDQALAELRDDVSALRNAVAAEGEARLARWDGWVDDEGFRPSARNFAHYLAFRRHDIRPLQRRMMLLGLSSLGRAEGRVLPALDAVLHLLGCAISGAPLAPIAAADFFASEARIAARAETLLGALSPESAVRLLVTLPSEAGADPGFLRRLAELGVEAVRINCAHDDEDAWGRMLAHVEAAAKTTGRRMKVFMDLAGPKIRTGPRREAKGLKRVHLGDRLGIALPGALARVPEGLPAIECTLARPLQAAQVGHRIFIDDGKLDTDVVEQTDWGLLVHVACAPEVKGWKLKPEKGLNFPDTVIDMPALTEGDIDALPFIAAHADAVEFSFVQSPGDVAHLQEHLARLRPDDWRRLGLILKVETSRALRNLPDMLVRAAGQQPTAVMIARGDLAVEIGFARLAEMQEEMLWLCEAAQIPVIWATQVLESYVKTGVPSRGEMTDAAMAARAECVMLNKGPHLFQAIADLDRLMGRMTEHVNKKTPQLRSLKSW